MKTTTNNHGVTVNVGCISCLYKDVNDGKGSSRYCTLRHEKVDKFDSCENWTINKPCSNAGRKTPLRKDINN